MKNQRYEPTGQAPAGVSPQGAGNLPVEIKSLVASLAIGCISSLSINTAINQSAIAQTTAQIRHQRAVGVPVVMPSYIPPGFRLISFKLSPPSSNNSYDATYQGQNSCEILIGGSDGGWGGPGSIRQWVINTQLLGKVILGEYDGSNSGGPNYLIAEATPTPDEKGPLRNYPKAGYVFVFTCKHNVFQHTTASKILRSMQIRR